MDSANEVDMPIEDALAGTAYRALSVLGAGSMGEVYDAEHVALRRRVVVKLIRREFAKDSGYVDRMRLEAQSLSVITPHPHLVSVLDYGRTPGGRAFLVMERLLGRTLHAELRERGALPLDEAVNLAGQLLSGLSAAHAVGIIHRDIKPANLFLCDGVARTLKILDFGIAKVLASGGNGLAPSPLAQPTAEGFTLGTPRFLSPEQALGHPADARADVYSVGVVFYLMIAGRDPFAEVKGAFNLMRAQAGAMAPRLSTVAKQIVPPTLERVVMRALEKDPRQRFLDAEEFRLALERALRNEAAPRWQRTEVIPVGVYSKALARNAASAAPTSLAPLTEGGGTERLPVGPSRAESVPLVVATEPIAVEAFWLPNKFHSAATEPVNMEVFMREVARVEAVQNEEPPRTMRGRPLAFLRIEMPPRMKLVVGFLVTVSCILWLVALVLWIRDR